jgi:hypothetical protein
MTKPKSKTNAAARSNFTKDQQTQVPREVHAYFFENYGETRH